MPPHTTTRRTTTNLKTKNNQNCQKIKLNGSLTAKNFKKRTFIHTGRRGRDGQPGWRGLAARQWLLELAVRHIGVDKPGGTTGE